MYGIIRVYYFHYEKVIYFLIMKLNNLFSVTNGQYLACERRTSISRTRERKKERKKERKRERERKREKERERKKEREREREMKCDRFDVCLLETGSQINVSINSFFSSFNKKSFFSPNPLLTKN